MRISHTLSLFSFVFTATHLVSGTAAFAQSGCVPGPGQVALFEHDSFRGDCVLREIGTYDTHSTLGIGGDSISSVRLGSNMQVELCEHERFRGRCETFTQSDPNLGDNRIGHDRTSSVRVSRLGTASRCTPPPGAAAVFEDSDFKGACRILGQGDYPTPAAMQFRNDSVSSVRVAADSSLLVCEHEYYRGQCQRVDGDIRDLKPEAIGGDRISSVKVLGRQHSTTCRPARGEIALFEDSDFKGACAIVRIGSYQTPSRMGFAGDAASSVRVGNETQIVIYRDENFGGDGQVLLSDMANLGQTRIGHDAVSSIKVQPAGTRECPIGPEQVAFYHHRDFVAPCRVEDIGDYPRVLSDTYSSIDVGGDVEVIICEDNSFGKDCERIGRDLPDLARNNRIGDDDISSYRVVKRGFKDCPVASNEVAFFDHRDFVAPCIVKPEGNYPTFSSLDKIGISSLRVGDEVQACVCTAQNFAGRCFTAQRRISDLRNTDVRNDSIRSARVQPRGAECKAQTRPGPAIVGVKSLQVFNCLPRDVPLWTLEIKAGARFKQVGTIRKSSGDGTCPTAATPSIILRFPDKTQVRWVAVDIDGRDCISNSPDQPRCQRDFGQVLGDTSGIAARVVVD